MKELEPPPDPEAYPPLRPRDKVVLVTTFVLAGLALWGIVAAWDRLPFIARPAP